MRISVIKILMLNAAIVHLKKNVKCAAAIMLALYGDGRDRNFMRM
jgi:hypothetical protein